MATIMGAALVRMREAERVCILEAEPPEGPGWYTLELWAVAGDGRVDGAAGVEVTEVLFVGETEDLRARLAWHHHRLQVGRGVSLERVCVRWVAARPIMGHDAWQRRARRAVEAVLVSTLRPVWDSDMVAALPA
jgi:hypothetical protein